MATDSTSASRDPARPSSSTSEPVRRDLRARRRRRGGRRHGLAAGAARRRGRARPRLRGRGPDPGGRGDAIAAACRAERFDLEQIAAAAADAATPVSRSCGRCARRCRRRSPSTCTTAPPARTSSTRPRCSSRGARSGRCSPTPARPPTPPPPWRTRTATTPIIGPDAAPAGAADVVRAQGGRLAGRRSTRRSPSLAAVRDAGLAVQMGGPVGRPRPGGRGAAWPPSSGSPSRSCRGTRNAARPVHSRRRSARSPARSPRWRAT